MAPPGAVKPGAFARTWRAFRAFVREQSELQERLALIYRPWDAEVLHWSAECELHGRYVPRRRGPRPVTRGGWCPCHREVMLRAER